MDIQASKIELAKMILETEDISIIQKIRNIFSGKADRDFFDELTEDQKLEIQFGTEQLEKGESIRWEEFKATRKNR